MTTTMKKKTITNYRITLLWLFLFLALSMHNLSPMAMNSFSLLCSIIFLLFIPSHFVALSFTFSAYFALYLLLLICILKPFNTNHTVQHHESRIKCRYENAQANTYISIGRFIFADHTQTHTHIQTHCKKNADFQMASNVSKNVFYS